MKYLFDAFFSNHVTSSRSDRRVGGARIGIRALFRPKQTVQLDLRIRKRRFDGSRSPRQPGRARNDSNDRIQGAPRRRRQSKPRSKSGCRHRSDAHRTRIESKRHVARIGIAIRVHGKNHEKRGQGSWITVIRLI